MGPSILFLVLLFFGGALVYLWLIGFHHLYSWFATKECNPIKKGKKMGPIIKHYICLDITFEQNSTYQNLVVVWQKTLTCHQNSKRIMHVLQFIALQID
jgi:hypothetical protein